MGFKEYLSEECKHKSVFLAEYFFGCSNEESINEESINEGGTSDKTKYNSEIPCLLAYAQNGDFKGFEKNNLKEAKKSKDIIFTTEYLKDYFDEKKINNSELTLSLIAEALNGFYDEKLFMSSFGISETFRLKVTEYLTKTKKTKPSQFSWAGLQNASGTAAPDDVGFDTVVAGISVKSVNAVTLKSLSPDSLKLTTNRGEDAISKYSRDRETGQSSGDSYWFNWKKKVVTSAIKLVKKEPGKKFTFSSETPEDSHYYIMYNKEEKVFYIKYKSGTGKEKLVDPDDDKTPEGKYKFTETNLKQKTNIATTNPHYAVFGNYAIQNSSEFKKLSDLVYNTLAKNISEMVFESFSTNSEIMQKLAIADNPYFYQSLKELYYVPSSNEFSENKLIVKKTDINYKMGKGVAGVMFTIKITTEAQEVSISPNYAQIDLHLRYQNRVFGLNPTVKVQNVKNLENIGWVKIS